MIENKQWFPTELHCHTVHSDGDFTVKELLETAKERKLSGICLTDHNSTAGHLEAKEQDEIAVLCGIEWTTYFGHMPVLGCKSFVDWRDALPDNIDEKLDLIHQSDGIAGMAHPFQLGTPICTGGRWDFKMKDFSKIDYMEIWSEGEPLLNSPNRRAMALWHQKLTEGYRITPTMGRDWHRPSRNIYHGACTYLLAEKGGLTDEKMKDAIKNGRTSISVGPLFYFADQYGNTIGDETKKGENRLTFFYNSERPDSMNLDYTVTPQKIRIVTENMETAAEFSADQKEIALALQKSYYTAQLWGKVGEKENQLIAFTAPIYTTEKEIRL